MTKDGAMVCFTVGLLITLFGVGGVEQSITNMELLSGVLVSIVGLAVMGCGSLAMRVLEGQ